MAPFDPWAEYYDLIQRGVEGDVEFYVAQALRAKGRTLEIGCGTGRVCIPMAMSGVDVAGLDNSRAMLEQCREKLEFIGDTKGRLQLIEADMRDFTLGEQFGFIAMPYRAIMHLLNPSDQRSCLACVRRHLAPDGLFIFNTWAARPSSIAPFIGASSGALRLVDKHTDENGQGGVMHYCASTYDEWAQLLGEDHLFHELDAEGAVVRSTSLAMVRAWTTPREMELLVALSGFEVEAVFGDFACGPFDRRSTEMIWVLRPAMSVEEESKP